MNRDDLDAFFAKADDVLDNWHPGTDAMVATVPADDGALPALADSYYDQARPDVDLLDAAASWLRLDTAGFRAVMAESFERVVGMIEAYAAPLDVEVLRGPSADMVILDETHLFRDEQPMDRALRLRRTRNTGPDDRRGLDGFHRRRVST